jgi:hypothetical protein
LHFGHVAAAAPVHDDGLGPGEEPTFAARPLTSRPRLINERWRPLLSLGVGHTNEEVEHEADLPLDEVDVQVAEHNIHGSRSGNGHGEVPETGGR